MKDKKILIIEILILIGVLLDLFLLKLPTYGIVLFLIGVLMVLKSIFKKEKRDYKNTFDLLLETFNFLLVFYILYYLYGLVMGFIPSHYYSIDSLIRIMIPIITFIIFREILRKELILKSKTNLQIALTIMICILLDIANNTYYLSYGESYNQTLLFVLSFFPVLTTNLVYTYLSKKDNEVIIIFFALVTTLTKYLFPIIPNTNIFVTLLINTLLPILLWVRIFTYYNNEDTIDRFENIKNIFILLIPTIVVTIMVYFYSGYFRYYALVVSGNNMSPHMTRGDLAIVDKKANKEEDIEVGDMIAYKANNHYIIQRVVEKRKEYGKFIYTTTDDVEDSYSAEVQEEQIIGKIPFHIKYLGYPTIWLNNQ